MNRRKGFTLIELLIVVTIIAILAGAAIPYVQDYIEESRRSRAKNDLDEIRNALVLYEINRRTNYPTSDIASLIGPFLVKAMNDPWGAPYVINGASSTCFTFGPDGQDQSGDEIHLEFRPRMAVSKIYWYDTHADGLIAIGDSVHLYTTRMGTGTPANSTLNPSWAGTLGLTGTWNPTYRICSYALLTSMPVPGSDTIRISAGSLPGSHMQDRSRVYPNAYAKEDTLKVIAP